MSTQHRYFLNQAVFYALCALAIVQLGALRYAILLAILYAITHICQYLIDWSQRRRFVLIPKKG